MAANELCEMCGHSLVWHEENKPRHKFNGDPMSLNEKPKVVAESPEPQFRPNMTDAMFAQVQHDRKVMVQAAMIDPVLRMALVNAGVITIEQIDAAQRMSDVLNGVARESTHFETPDHNRQ